MRRLVLAVPVLLCAAGCSTDSSPKTPGAILQAYDAANGHPGGTEGQYQEAFDKVAPKCTQSAAQLPAMVEATYQLLVKAGISDETALTVLGHLDASIPAGSGPMNCVDQLAAYATLREG